MGNVLKENEKKNLVLFLENLDKALQVLEKNAVTNKEANVYSRARDRMWRVPFVFYPSRVLSSKVSKIGPNEMVASVTKGANVSYFSPREGTIKNMVYLPHDHVFLGDGNLSREGVGTLIHELIGHSPNADLTNALANYFRIPRNAAEEIKADLLKIRLLVAMGIMTPEEAMSTLAGRDAIYAGRS
jgi:hypothetical protein